MKHIVKVDSIEVYAYHGCMDEEALIGSKYLVDVEIEANISQAIESDKLEETVDYVLAANAVVKQMKVRSALIEHVAGRIIKQIRTESTHPIEKVQVSIKKLAPPIEANAKYVGVTIIG